LRYESWLIELLATCRVLVVDERTAVLYAEIRHELKRSGHPIPENDIWIAALARQHNAPLVTRDQHFDFVHGLKRLNW
jgi:tRNA(fMet)-specific endonuclease VapC